MSKLDLTAFMAKWEMVPPPGGTVLCAVSGGRDSVCLLHYMKHLGDRLGFSVAAGHYNHHMRPTAQRDEDFVRSLCDGLDVPFYTDGAAVEEVAQSWGMGVEETGRRLRYGFLESLADRLDACFIATAHHRGDQAETVLLQLLRGTGTEGLGGIPARRGRLIRPLLDTSRQEIEAYLRTHGLAHVEDETNASLRFARNRLRLQVVPELEKINPRFRENVARTAEIARRESRYLDELAAARLPREGASVACEVLCAAPEALQGRMVRLLWDRLGLGRRDFTAAHVEAVLSLLHGGDMVSLPRCAAAVRTCGEIRLEKRETAPPPLVLTGVGEYRWGPWRVSVGEESGGLTLRADGDGVLTVDTWRRGEGLQLSGSRGRRSVKRLLQERGVPAEMRQSVPCLRLDGQLAAVWGLGTDRKFLQGDTKWVIRFDDQEK